MKNLSFILSFLVVFPIYGFTQDIAMIQKEAEKLELTNDDAAFKKYQEILKIQPVNIHALCKSSELCSSIGHQQKTKASQIDYFKTARHYAEIALRLNANSSDANFVMAIAMGRLALVVGGKEKIEAVNGIKKYAELSIKANPANYKPYHILGRWYYEVSSLSGIERTAAKIFFGGLPPASLSQAIVCYEKSMALSPDATVNYPELAKCYAKNNQKNKAIDLLNKLMTMPTKTKEDIRVKEEGKKLLANWAKVLNNLVLPLTTA